MHSVILKIDLCGSKEFVDRVRAGEILTRATVLSKLVAATHLIFPNATQNYPDGSYYGDEGDAVMLVLDRPTVALRCAIEFQKSWYSNIPSLPDCRIVLDYGQVEAALVNNRTRLSGEPFENIGKFEKEFGPGAIGVTTAVKDHADGTLASFARKHAVTVTTKRKIQTWAVNYENPRTLEDSALAHALFIANPIGDDIRTRTFEALAIECLLQRTPQEATLSAVNEWLYERGCPKLAVASLKALADGSQHVELKAGSVLVLSKGSAARFEEFRTQYEEERTAAGNELRRSIASKIKALEDFDFLPVVEQYLCAVCLEIRMMANYFRATNSLFDRLADTSEFDFILKRHFPALSDRPEEMSLLKRLLLEAMRSLTLNNNGYIAAIFHNVLMLYYLNRTTTTSQGTLPVLRNKKIFLDTSAFYSLRCNSMLFHDVLKFSVERLATAGAKIFLFDKSLEEYNQSLEATLHNYEKNRGVAYMWRRNAPFIWTEYTKNRQLYSNNFQFCVAVHRVPKRADPGSIDFDRAAEELRADDIELVQLSPYLDQSALGGVYNDVHTAKDEKDRAPEPLFALGVDFFDKRVLHDANCIYRLLRQGGGNPYSAESLFVTCDFYLANIRRIRPGRYEFVTTAPEFYEFLLPYLFAADTITQEPVSTPNFLLAAALSGEMQKGLDLRSLFGAMLTENQPGHAANYEILSELQSKERFSKIKSRWHDAKVESSPDVLETQIAEVQQGFLDYVGSVREGLEASLYTAERRSLGDKLQNVETENLALRRELEQLRQKVHGREKHLRRTEKPKKKR